MAAPPAPFSSWPGSNATYKLEKEASVSGHTGGALAEARTDPSTDCGVKWLVARRSTDGGATWSRDAPVGRGAAFLASGNPQAVFHAPSGRVVVVFGSKDTREPGGCSPGDGVVCFCPGLSKASGCAAETAAAVADDCAAALARIAG